MTVKATTAERFNAMLSRVVRVSKEELAKREAEYQRERKRERQRRERERKK